MPKYRYLTKEELQSLEKEFIEYLIVNGITADDWEKMKKEQPAEAENIVGLFSDVVFEGTLRKIKFLEYREAYSLRTFQALETKIVLVAMTAEPREGVDFTKPEYLQKAMDNPPPSLKVFTSYKNYSKQRELELFEMMETGCLISDGELFKTLCLALPNQDV